MGSGEDDCRGCGSAQDTGYLTSFSIDGEYASFTSSEATQRLSDGLRGVSNGGCSWKRHRGFSRLILTCFQPWLRPLRLSTPTDDPFTSGRPSGTVISIRAGRDVREEVSTPSFTPASLFDGLVVPMLPGPSQHLPVPKRVAHPFREPLQFIVIAVMSVMSGAFPDTYRVST